MMTRKSITILLCAAMAVVAALLLIFSLNVNRTDTQMINDYTEKTLSDMSQTQWDDLAQKTIYFGHMSVGYNIMGGMETVLKQNTQIPVRVSETEATHTFIHGKLGSNTLPLNKITAFQSQIRQMQTPPDIAFLKFCYVDVNASTDVEAVFEAYRKMISELQAEFPNTLIMHCTVPLTTTPPSPKSALKNVIKTVLGKATIVDDNIKRTEFNTILKETYPAKTMIDIALAESTTPEGKHCFKMKKGTKVPFLIKEYTFDGGHLNEVGGKRVAEYLLIRLAGVSGSE